MQLPATVVNRGRFMARLLKHLRRTWSVRCVALDVDAEVRRLQRIIDGLAARVAAQSELLSAKADKRRTG